MLSGGESAVNLSRKKADAISADRVCVHETGHGKRRNERGNEARADSFEGFWALRETIFINRLTS